MGRRASDRSRARARRRSSGRSGGARDRAMPAAAPRAAAVAAGSPALDERAPGPDGPARPTSVSGRPSPSSSTGLSPCHVVAGSTTSTSRGCWDCTTTGAATLRVRVRTSNRYSPDLPPGRREVHDPRLRPAAALADGALPDAADRPVEVRVAGRDGDVELLSRVDRHRRRLRGEVAHGDPATAGKRLRVAGPQRQRHRRADVPRLVARADDDEVRAGGDAAAVDGAVPLPPLLVVGELQRLVEDLAARA